MSEDSTLDLFSFWTPFEAVDLRKSKYKQRAHPNGGKVEAQVGRIRGIVGSESKDQHDEVWCIDGADVSYFLEKGWFNYEHQPGPDNVLGHPERTYKTRDANGKPALGVEGVLYLGFKKARDVWDSAMAMKGTGRSLGFSVEGFTQQRVGGKKVFEKNRWVTRGGRLIKSRVLNAAITAHPVNPWTKLEVLAKAHDAGIRLGGVPQNTDGFLSALRKAHVGYQQNADVGSGSISALVPQSIDHGVSVAQFGQTLAAGRSVTREELALVLTRAYPWLSYNQALGFARRIIDGNRLT